MSSHDVLGQVHALARSNASHCQGESGLQRQAWRFGRGLPRGSPRAEICDGYVYGEWREGQDSRATRGSSLSPSKALRSLQGTLPWVRLERMDGGNTCAEAKFTAKCARAHS